MALVFHQWLGGKDFGAVSPYAEQMANFVYGIGDDESRECLLVDPAWDIQGILGLLDAQELKLSGVLLTHYHADHCGGSVFGMEIEGISELLAAKDVPIYCQRSEAEWILKGTGVAPSALKAVDHGTEVPVGKIRVRCMHTPGHTPGSQCFCVQDQIVTGDTLFLHGCGRTDLPGGNPEELYASLKQIKALDPNIRMFPGHAYAPQPSAKLEDVIQSNPVLHEHSLQQFLRMMGH
jgi:glyoxylase-like metal-dependent hydrolase (beta-lactamase superfamily II)